LTNTMQAYVAKGPDGVEALSLLEVPMPKLQDDDVLVRVRAFPINTGMTEQLGGTLKAAYFPFVPGNELVGEISNDPLGRYAPGTKVAVAFFNGEMRLTGLNDQGAYAEYIAVNANYVFPFESDLPWPVLAAIPGAFATAWDALLYVSQAQEGQSVLIRGGTSGVGLAVATIAKAKGMTVASTTRDESKLASLRAHGVNDPVLDNREISGKLESQVDVAVHLTGFSTLGDTLQCVKPFGIACMVGVLGEYETVHTGSLVSPHPVDYVPHAVRLTSRRGPYPGRKEMQDWVDGVAAGTYQMPIDKVFPYEETVEALKRRKSQIGFGRIIVEMGHG